MNDRPLRYVSRREPATPAATLRALADAIGDDTPDLYGAGALIDDFERDVAQRLGKDAAVFSLSGKAAQLGALRVHAERRARSVIAAHPRSHIVEDEDDAIGRLHGLRVARTGTLWDPFTAAHVAAHADPLAAVVIELPLRRAGYRVPAWDEVEAIATVARARGAALHLDGARLWEVAPGYGRSLAELAAPFDTVYVSFYKGLGGLAGAMVAGDAETVAAVRAWTLRAGAIVYRAYPFVVAAREGLRREGPRMAEYHAYAVRLAAQLHGLDGVDVSPNPPVSTAFLVHVRGTFEGVEAAVTAVRDARGLVVATGLNRSTNPQQTSFELTVGANTVALDPAEIRDAVGEIITLAAASAGGP